MAAQAPLIRHVEALVFCATDPLTVGELARCLSDHLTPVSEGQVETLLTELQARYDTADYAFGLRMVAGGYQFFTKPAYHATLETLLRQNVRKRLSTAALETLAIVAYQQPVTKTQVEQIRGVNCDYALQKLLEKELIEITGKASGAGRPLLYGTSRRFMEHFGLQSLKDLPLPRDMGAPGSQIGPETPEDTP